MTNYHIDEFTDYLQEKRLYTHNERKNDRKNEQTNERTNKLRKERTN